MTHNGKAVSVKATAAMLLARNHGYGVLVEENSV